MLIKTTAQAFRKNGAGSLLFAGINEEIEMQGNAGTSMGTIWDLYGECMENIWVGYGKHMGNIWKKYGNGKEGI